MRSSLEVVNVQLPYTVNDVKPATPISAVDREELAGCLRTFPVRIVAPVVGMSTGFIRKVLGHNETTLSGNDVLRLLDQDAFAETIVPRSRVFTYLQRREAATLRQRTQKLVNSETRLGCALSLLDELPEKSIQCVVTSTPYWAMRLYEDMTAVEWADGEICPFGMEQTPEGFIRHSTEVLLAIMPVMKDEGSVWWNIMDTFNTRTQIRSNAAEALRAMQGKDSTAWGDHACRRYSAGHSFLKDGEQCLIPFRIAERASRIGYYAKSVISWTKTSSLPEPQKSRVSRSVEYILHLALQRTPYFDKDAYLRLPSQLGGKNGALESAKLSDFWHLPTSAGRDGHGAQFHLALPGRCIGLTTKPGDFVLEPFLGAGTSAVAARLLGRRYIGFDVSQEYLQVARARLRDLDLDLDTNAAIAVEQAREASPTSSQ